MGYPDGTAEADRQTAIGIHQADRERDIHDVPRAEHRTGRLKPIIRSMRLGNLHHGFRPAKRCKSGEKVSGFYSAPAGAAVGKSIGSIVPIVPACGHRP